MLRQSRKVLGLLQCSSGALNVEHACCASAVNAQQYRHIGGDKIPEYWGRPSPYTEGTNFLGTPRNHLEIIKKRPLSPDVLEIDHKSLHYKFPWGALSSITNRVTGVAMSVGVIGASWIALRGNLPELITGISSTSPILLFPFKFAVAYTIIYHYLGGVRHFVWDHHKIGNQADKTSLLEITNVEKSSKVLFAASAGLSFVAALL